MLSGVLQWSDLQHYCCCSRCCRCCCCCCCCLLRFCCCLLLAAAVPDCSPAAQGDIYSKRSPCCQADRGVYRAKHFSAIRTTWQGNRMCGASACYLSQIFRSWAERQSGVARRGNPPLAIYQALQYVWYHQQEIKRRHTRHNVWIQSNLARLIISGCDFLSEMMQNGYS